MATIEETLKQTQDLLKRIPKEGVTDTSGNLMPISFESLNKAYKAVNLPELPQEDISKYKGMIMGGSNLTTPFFSFDTNSNEESSLLKKYLEGEKPTDPSKTYESLYQTAGIEEKTQDVLEKEKAVKSAQNELNLIQAQLKGITDEATAENLKLEQQGAAITTGGLARSQQANIREKAIQALPLQAQALVAQAKIASTQGDQELSQKTLELAQDKLNTAFKLQSDYEDRLFNYNKELRDRVWEYADKKQQEKLQAQQLADTRAYNEKRDLINNAQTVANGLLDTQPDLAAKISAIDWSKSGAQNEFARLQGQVKVNSTTPTGKTIKSGNLIIPESDIAEGQTGLEQARGDDGYVYTPLYLQMLQKWIDKKGLAQDFFSQYPPKNYLNPNDASVPKWIRDKLKTTSIGGSTSGSSSSGVDFDDL